ncbi:MAG TPA: low temperature requirement protein A [Streptosporangiaceae bacterium]
MTGPGPGAPDQDGPPDQDGTGSQDRGVTGPAGAANSSSPNEPVSTMDITDPNAPLRVTTLELFFDLVFAFTLTQLASLLEHHFSPSGAFEVLLVFGVLWWMYGGYAWLTNSRAPTRTLDRLLLLLGMAGFLICGLAIPRGFGPGDTETRVALGVGYLIVVLVHTALFYRVNRNIVRVTPFNVGAALLVIGAAFVSSPASYLLWAAAVAVQWLSPLIAHPGGRFDIRPAHFAERHGALVIVALGESVAAIGIGAAPAGVTFSVALAAVLGLALSAVLWWTYFGDGDDERAEQAIAATDRSRRAGLALAIYYAHIPILLGVVTLAAGAALTIGNPARPHPGEAVAVAGGAALFLAGSAWFRWALRIGPIELRLAGAGFALATAAIGATVNAEVQLAVLLAGIVAMLAGERYVRLRPRAAARG